MKKIVWITADYFIDVDFQIVPYMKEVLGMDIQWKVIRTNKNIYVDRSLDCEIYELSHKSMDPRVLFDYIRIFSDVVADDISLVYSDFVGFPYYYFYLFHKIDRKKIIHAAHNIIPYSGWPHKRLMTKYLNFVFSYGKNFHIFSKHLVDYFCSRFSDKSIMLCPMTVKSYGNDITDEFHIDESKLNLLFFGNVKLNKRLDLAISAIKQLPSGIKENVSLLIAGKCDDASEYLTQIGDCKSITPYFKRVDDKFVPELFTKCDYLLLPYSNVAQSGPHMIAYAYNMPVIASDIDGFSEHVEDGQVGFLFQANNVDSLVNTIVEAYESRGDKYAEMKRKLKEKVDGTYSVESVASKYLNYFKSICK